MLIPVYLKRSKKTGRYSYRRRIPKDLVEVFGKREEKIALGTTNLNMARQRALHHDDWFEGKIKQLRDDMGDSDGVSVSESMLQACP